MPTPKRLDISTLEGWLWDAACVIRGPLDAPKFSWERIALAAGGTGRARVRR